MVARTSFAGLGQADDTNAFGPGIEPPDPWVAVGPADVVQSVNSLIRITDRAGTPKTQVTAQSFFGVLPAQVNSADPRIIYDAQHDRWVGTYLSYDCTDGYLYLAVSQTNDPTGTWRRWYFTYAGYLPDYPGLGSSDDKIAISADEFVIDPLAPECIAPSSPSTSLLVVDWAATLGSGPIGDAYFRSPGYSSWRPAPNHSPGTAIHVVGQRLSDGDVTYASITGDVANPNAPGPDPAPVQFVGPVDVTAIAPFTTPPAPRQPGFPSTISAAVDSRPTDAIWTNGSLWFVSTYPLLLARDSSLRDTVRVTELRTGASPTIRQDFVIGFAGFDTYMGGLGIAGDGTAYVVYSTSSPTDYVSTWANLQHPSDPVDSYSDTFLVASGGGTYQGGRWGDYVGVATDPIDPKAVWAADEIPTSGGGWTTRVAMLESVGQPDAPRSAAAQAGNGSVQVSWLAPAWNGERRSSDTRPPRLPTA